MRLLRTIILATALAVSAGAWSQETNDLAVTSSQSLLIPWVGIIKSHFVARTDEILNESGNSRIEWNEVPGGTPYKANATLTSAEEDVTDVGWVFSFLEPAKLPLSQTYIHAPFATSNPAIQLEVMSDLCESSEAFRNEWERYNLKVLGFTRTDGHDVYTRVPLDGFAALNGMKISAPGVFGNWLRGTWANAFDGALTTFCTDIQTGVSDRVLSLAPGVLPAKIYEFAPNITRVKTGVTFSGAVAISRDTWDSLPEEVRTAMIAASDYYTVSHGKDLLERHETALAAVVVVGASQNPTVTIAPMSEEDRQTWLNAMPNIAGERAVGPEAQGVSAADFMRTDLERLRARGETPVRSRDEEL
jgi:TRAP-type C4-dicarboxylate transport system substrate-binding protein